MNLIYVFFLFLVPVNYRKAFKFRKGKSGDAATKLRPYKSQKEMSFLKPFLQDREQKSNLVETGSISNSPDVCEDEEESNDRIEDNDNVSETEPRAPTPASSSSTTMGRTISTSIRKKDNSLSLYNI